MTPTTRPRLIIRPPVRLVVDLFAAEKLELARRRERARLWAERWRRDLKK